MTPERPPDAWWSEKDQEWVYGAKDDQGRLTGPVRYWDAEGVFISEADHVEGKPHGRARRFHPDGSVAQECHYIEGRIEGVRAIHRPKSEKAPEWPRFRDLDASIVLFECVYAGGDLIGTRFRNAGGVEVDRHGDPVEPRPKGVEDTATPFQGGWLFMRRKGEDGDETLEMRQYFADGSIREESLPDGTNREFHESGALQSEGKRVWHQKKRPQHGLWRYGDEHGMIRRESHYVHGAEEKRTWRRPQSEAGVSCTIECSGPTSSLDRFDAVESGLWEFREGSGQVKRKVDLGEALSDEALLQSAALDDAATLEQLGAVAQGTDAAARVARFRLAARRGSFLAWLEPETSWSRLNRQGELETWGRTLNESINALAFVATVDVVAALAARVFRADRPRVALELVDAALLLHEDEKLRESRVGYLRALGEHDAANEALDIVDPERVQTRERELLLRIRQSPDDDVLRLEYADLVEHVAPNHAALIRWDCGEQSSARAGARAKLVANLKRKLPEGMQHYPFERGFVATDTHFVDAETFSMHHDVLFRLAPLAARLDLMYATDWMADLTTRPSLRRYTSLVLWDTLLFDGQAAQLARSPHLEQLRRLSLRDTDMYDEDLEPILRSSAFPRLESLDISNNREGQNYTFEGFKRIAESTFAPTLGELAMDRRYFDDDLVSVFAQLPVLHSLSLEGSSLGTGAIDLASLDRAWKSLDLTRSGINTACAKALAASPYMTELLSLRLASNPLGDEGIRALVNSPHLARVQTLDLGGSHPERTTAELAKALRTAPMAASLKTLLLSLSALGPEGATALAEAPLHQLSRLNLHNNAIGDEGAIALARSQHLHGMRHLDISGPGLTDASAHALAESECFANLDWLELGGAEFSKKGRKALKKRFGDRVQFDYPWGRR